jgi:hypothetical protein
MKFNNLKPGACALHTGEVVGSIPTAPTINVKDLAGPALERAHVSPMKSTGVAN